MLAWVREVHARLGARRRHARYLARWRSVNAHNEVQPVGYVDPTIVSIGKRSYGDLRVSRFGNPAETLSIGNYVSIAPGVHFVLGGNHPVDGLSTFPFRVKLCGDAWEGTTKGPIVVGDDVWIGTDSLILSGVTIGQGAVVAARSVVTRDVPPYTIVGGNPARVIRRRFSEAITARLLTLDFSTLDEVKVVNNIDRIYASLTEDSVDEVMGLVIRQLR